MFPFLSGYVGRGQLAAIPQERSAVLPVRTRTNAHDAGLGWQGGGRLRLLLVDAVAASALVPAVAHLSQRSLNVNDSKNLEHAWRERLLPLFRSMP